LFSSKGEKMINSGKTGMNWTKLLAALALMCSMFSFGAMAQTKPEKPLAKAAADALVGELKEGLADLIEDEDSVAVIVARWDTHNLAGKTRTQILNLLFSDVKSVVEDKETQDSIWEDWKEVGLEEEDAGDETPVETPKAAPTTKSKYSVAELTIRERQAGDVTILDLEGKITEGGGTTALRNAIRGLLDEGKRKILLNCKGVSNVDENGIGEMVASYTATTNKGGQLKLLNLPIAFKDLLMIAKFLTIFQTYDNEQEALASFN
jgi:anti-sigma B factor antagonist